MRIDWDALLLSTSPAIASNGDAPDARCEEVPAGAGIASREREGDDRRRCSECGNLGERGVCLAAYRGEIVAGRGYSPMRDILRRCEGFMPLLSDPDQRHGRDKWAWLSISPNEQSPSESP